jgi:hypothetical protein
MIVLLSGFLVVVLLIIAYTMIAKYYKNKSAEMINKISEINAKTSAGNVTEEKSKESSTTTEEKDIETKVKEDINNLSEAQAKEVLEDIIVNNIKHQKKAQKVQQAIDETAKKVMEEVILFVMPKDNQQEEHIETPPGKVEVVEEKSMLEVSAEDNTPEEITTTEDTPEESTAEDMLDTPLEIVSEDNVEVVYEDSIEPDY